MAAAGGQCGDVEDEPELYVVKPSDWPGADEWRAKHESDKAEARGRYLQLATAELDASGVADPAALAESLFDLLFMHGRQDDRDCACGCHPHLPASDFHDFGFACPCSQSPGERSANANEWRAEIDAYWASPEGRATTAQRQAEEAELAVWIADHPGVELTSHGGWAPEQWNGTVDGRRFYFRERHDAWRIELDLRPSGRFARVWTGGDLGDEDSIEVRELEEGDVIAEGTTGAVGFGHTPAERADFIVTTIRDHLRRVACEVHRSVRPELTRGPGGEVRFCSACGERLDLDQ